MHAPDFGDNHNLYLQHKIGDQKIGNTTEYFEEKDRHIKLDQTVYIAAFLNGEKVFEDYVKVAVKSNCYTAGVNELVNLSIGKFVNW